MMLLRLPPSLITSILGCLVLAGSLGCRARVAPMAIPPRYSLFSSPHLAEARPRRILVMPPVSPSKEAEAARRWQSQLANELRTCHAFEVVLADPSLACVAHVLEDMQRGLYSEAGLVELRDTLRVDGVMFVTVHEHWPYWPPRIAAATHIVDATTGETLLSVDGNWDGRDDATRRWAAQYAQCVTTTQDVTNPELILQSPEYFGKFVAHDMAQAICCRWNMSAAAAASSATAQAAANGEVNAGANQSQPTPAREEELPPPSAEQVSGIGAPTGFY